MNWKKKFRAFFTMTCTSFTIIMLLYTALSGWLNAALDVESIFKLFGVCVMAGLAVFITDFIPVETVPLRLAVDFLDVFLTVFVFGGGVMRLFSFQWEMALIVFGMLSAAFLGVAALMFFNEQADATGINRKISEMKQKHRTL